MKRTLGNSRLKRTRKSGFRSRNKSKIGKKVLKKRRLKGRKRLAL